MTHREDKFDTIFDRIGLNCEHCALKKLPVQLGIPFLCAPRFIYIYTSNSTREGRRISENKQKIIRIDENKINPDRCPIELYERMKERI